MKRRKTMKAQKKQSGYALLLEILVACSIGLTFLAGILISSQKVLVANQQNAVWSVLRAVNQSEGFYYRVFHNGYVLPAVLANSNTGSIGTVAAQGCDTPGFLGGDYASETTLPLWQGYTFTFVLGPTVPSNGTGCTNPGAVSYTLVASPVNRGNQTGMYFYTDQSGLIRYSQTGPANAASPVLPW
jgi:type IV pilus assembly protein PilA